MYGILTWSCSWMTFCPEWLTGSQYLNTDNVLHFWVYLVVRDYDIHVYLRTSGDQLFYACSL